MRLSVSRHQILTIAGPIAFSLLIPQMGLFWNTVFVSQLSPHQQAVYSIGLTFYLVQEFIGYGLVNGVLVLLSRRSGENDSERLAKTMGNSIILAAITSLLLMLLTIWITPLLFGISLFNSDTFLDTIDYVYLRIWGYPFFMLSQLFNIFFISISKTKYLILGSLANFLCYITLAPVLMNGLGGILPAKGLAGNAYAGIAGESMNLAVLLIIYFSNKVRKEFPIFNYIKLNAAISITTIKTALPLIIQYLFTASSWLVFIIFIEHTGILNLAAANIVRNVFNVCSIGIVALANTCNSMTGNLMGQGRSIRVLQLVRKTCSLSLTYGLILGIFMFGIPENLLGFYSSKPEIIDRGIAALKVSGISLIVMSLATICFNAVVGTGNTMVNLVLELISVIAYLTYLGFYFSNGGEPLFVGWIANIVYWSVLLIGSSAYLLFGNWKTKKL